MTSGERLADLVADELGRLADPDKAEEMAAYMKTGMPFYGVTKADRTPVFRRLVAEFPPADAAEYRRNVLVLWNGDHREEKYLAVGYARRFKEHIALAQVGLYGRMVQEGAWWDLVDDIAANLVGSVVLDHRDEMRPLLEQWIDDPDMWLRRTAILCQLRHKEETDEAMLFDFCGRLAEEKEFFIRKAIGWALREYSKTNPDAVRRFLANEGDRLSGLSRREASKYV